MTHLTCVTCGTSDFAGGISGAVNVDKELAAEERRRKHVVKRQLPPNGCVCRRKHEHHRRRADIRSGAAQMQMRNCHTRARNRVLDVVAEHACARVVPKVGGARGGRLHLRHALAPAQLCLIKLLERGQRRGDHCKHPNTKLSMHEHVRVNVRARVHVKCVRVRMYCACKRSLVYVTLNMLYK